MYGSRYRRGLSPSIPLLSERLKGVVGASIDTCFFLPGSDGEAGKIMVVRLVA